MNEEHKLVDYINLDINVEEIVNTYYNHLNYGNWNYNPKKGDEDTYTLSLPIDGEYYFKINGSEYVAHKGLVILRNGLDEFCSYAKTPSHKYIVIVFKSNSKKITKYIKVINTLHNYEYFLNLFKRALYHYENKSICHQMLVKSDLLYILSSIISDNLTELNMNKKYNIIRPSIYYIEKNIFDKNLDIERIALESKISSRYFRDIFQQIFNVSPVKYINDRRLKEAEDLLLCTSYNINEIANQIGYNSSIYFDKIFKKKYGIPPGEYRRINKNNLLELR